MTLDEYLGQKGLSSPVSDYTLDKLRLPHGETQRQSAQRMREAVEAQKKYQDQRKAAIAEYGRLVSAGEIIKPSQIEIHMKAARGHEDNFTTQAARRALEKRGIDWRTGEKISMQKRIATACAEADRRQSMKDPQKNNEKQQIAERRR